MSFVKKGLVEDILEKLSFPRNSAMRHFIKKLTLIKSMIKYYLKNFACELFTYLLSVSNSSLIAQHGHFSKKSTNDSIIPSFVLAHCELSSNDVNHRGP